MRFAKIERSQRLQRTLKALQSARELSTLELIHQANIVAVNSAISEQRRNGYSISCRSVDRVYYYRLGEE
jgi:hypothetical protein